MDAVEKVVITTYRELGPRPSKIRFFRMVSYEALQISDYLKLSQQMELPIELKPIDEAEQLYAWFGYSPVA
jgi:hypothetical protein